LVSAARDSTPNYYLAGLVYVPLGRLRALPLVKEESAMDENRIGGAAKNIEGKVQEGLGRVAGDTDATIQGKVKQAVGEAQYMYGQVKDSAGDAVDAIKDASASVEDSISTYIENNPYTSVAIALGLGWLIGRSHRPF
jgi:uncharacterized protein YjbJ (UPF0337 family)